MNTDQSQQNVAATSQAPAPTLSSSSSLFRVSEPSMQPAELNNLLVQMRKPLKAGLVQFSRDMLRRMKRLRQKRGSDVELTRNAQRADRLLEQVRLLRRWSQQSLCKALLGHDTSLAEALSAAPSSPVAVEQLALARLANTNPIRHFVDKFRAEHSDWRDLVYFMQYKNTGGRWKRKQPPRPKAPSDLLAKSVKQIASKVGPDDQNSDDNNDDHDDDDDEAEQEAERRRRLESVLLEFRKETAGEPSIGVAMDANFGGALAVSEASTSKVEKSVVKIASKTVAKDANVVARVEDSVAKDANSVSEGAKSATKDKKPAIVKKAKAVVNAEKSVVPKKPKSVASNTKKSVAKHSKSADSDDGSGEAGECADRDGWSDLFATDVPPMEMKRGLHMKRRITTDGADSLGTPRHGERQSRKRRRDVQAQERRTKQAAMEAEQLHPSWQAKRQQKALLAAAAAATPARIVFDDD